MREEKMPSFLSVIRGKVPRHFTQVLATLAVSLGPFSAGLGKGYSSPALASLQESRNTFAVSPQEGSWVASLSLLGAMFGCLFGGVMLQLGRRASLLIVALPFSGSWLLTVYAHRIELMYSTSFIGGFCSAITLLATQVYVSEISHPEIRGCLSSVLKMAGHLGTLSSFALGAFLDWRKLAAVAASAPLLLFLAVLPIPETPSFLLYHGREEEATKSLVWLRPRGEDITSEMETLRSNISSKKRSFLPSCSSLLTRHLVIVCGLMFFQKFSGVTVFSFYAVPIFKKMFNRTLSVLPDAAEIVQSYNESFVAVDAQDFSSPHSVFNESLSGGDHTFLNVFGRSLNPHGAAIVVVFLQLLGSMTSGLLIDTAGRLPLLTISNLFISGSFFGFGLYNYMEESLPPSHPGFGPSLDWIPLTCVLFFTLFFSIGIGPISWLMVGELFPLEYRNFGGAVSTSFSYACAFAAVKTYVDINNQIGLYGAFWVYAAVSIAGLLFVCVCVPETRGRELEEATNSTTASQSARPSAYNNETRNQHNSNSSSSSSNNNNNNNASGNSVNRSINNPTPRYNYINLPNPLSRIIRNPSPVVIPPNKCVNAEINEKLSNIYEYPPAAPSPRIVHVNATNLNSVSQPVQYHPILFPRTSSPHLAHNSNHVNSVTSNSHHSPVVYRPPRGTAV